VAGSSGCKKSKAPNGLHAMRQAVGMMPTAGRLSIEQGLPQAAPTVETLTIAAVEVATLAILAPSLPPAVVQDVAPTTAEVVVLSTQVGLVVVCLPSSQVLYYVSVWQTLVLPRYRLLHLLCWLSLLLSWRPWRRLLHPGALVSPLIICTLLVILTHYGV